jgi:hypothetical protein
MVQSKVIVSKPRGHYKDFFSISILLSLVLSTALKAQPLISDKEYVEQMILTGSIPENLLSTKSIVLHSYTLSETELETIQDNFQKSGIDAVIYYPIDMVIAGKDFTKVFSELLVKREIANVIFVEKYNDSFRVSITKFNGKESIIEKQQQAWTITNNSLSDLLKIIYRNTSAGFKKQNLLINVTAEPGNLIDAIAGNRNEFFAVDMKVDLVGIPKFGDEVMDKELEKIVSENFPFKFRMTEPGVSERDLRKQGIFYVLCFVHTRAKVAKEILGYNITKSESAIVSVTYPDGQPQLKNIPSNTPVYKVYFKHIDSGNIFLGTKWDADITWQSALLNNIRAMRVELRLN